MPGPSRRRPNDQAEWQPDQRSPVRKPKHVQVPEDPEPFLGAAKKAARAVRAANKTTKPRAKSRKATGDPKEDLPVLARSGLARANWQVIYAEFMAGDPISVIAERHGIPLLLLNRVAVDCGWNDERHKFFLRLQQTIKDRLEDITIDETERMVRAHFNLATEAIDHLRDMLPHVKGAKDQKDWTGAFDILMKAQRLSGGLTNYIGDPANKTGKAESDLASDLDDALGIVEGES